MTLERAGVPTVAVATDLFAGTARNEAELYGLLALPIALVEHPVAGCARETVRARAEAVAAEIVMALTADAAALRAFYTGRVVRTVQPGRATAAAAVGMGPDEVCEVCLVE